MDPHGIPALQDRFGIADGVRFIEGPNSLTTVAIDNGTATARITLQGAQLLEWMPEPERPVIWLSPLAGFEPGRPIRGGVPICWPWFGPNRDEPRLPAHGFARTAPWEVFEVESLDDGSSRLGFRLIRSEASFAQWPHSAPLEIRYTLGSTLEIELRTENREPVPLAFSEALHTYFGVSDVRRIGIQGLDGCDYIDKADGGRRKRQTGPITFDGETDRIYLGTTADCCIDDPGFGRRIRIEKRGSRSTVVWNPWEEKARRMGDFGENGHLGMVCLETANADEDRVILAPGEEHRLWVRYSVEILA